MTGSPELASDAAAQPGCIVARVAPHDVPLHLAASDVGLAYRSDSFSMQGVAPVKLSEYLLCGLPVVGTSAIGETSDLVRHGLFLDEGRGIEDSARWLLEDVLPQRERYRELARARGVQNFSLRRTLQDYAGAIAAVSFVPSRT
jgi:glycosyltransferase involved in cell wall biosynthesis